MAGEGKGVGMSVKDEDWIDAATASLTCRMGVEVPVLYLL
jgi:hypothetical protein